MTLLMVGTLIALGFVTSLVAEHKGQSPVIWFLLGAAFPGVALVILIFGVAAEGGEDHDPPTREEAAKRSVIARELARTRPRSPRGLSQATGFSVSEVRAHLRALESLDLAAMVEDGRWKLTASGLDAIQERDR